jgi:hypothetical protein
MSQQSQQTGPLAHVGTGGCIRRDSGTMRSYLVLEGGEQLRRYGSECESKSL